MLSARSFVGSLTGCLILLGATLAQAQERRVEGDARRDEGRARQHGRRMSTILNSRVTIQGDMAVGKVVDFVVSDEGRIDYLVVAEQGKFVLVPWAAARVNFESRSVVLSVPRDRWREAPTFTEERWSDVGNPQYIQRVRTFYNAPADRRGIREDGRDRKEDRRDNRQDRREDRRDNPRPPSNPRQ